MLSSPGEVQERSTDVCVMFDDERSVIDWGGVVSGTEDWFVVNVLSVEADEFDNSSADVMR